MWQWVLYGHHTALPAKQFDACTHHLTIRADRSHDAGSKPGLNESDAALEAALGQNLGRTCCDTSNTYRWSRSKAAARRIWVGPSRQGGKAFGGALGGRWVADGPSYVFRLGGSWCDRRKCSVACERGAAVVRPPRTGDLGAMSSTPGHDLHIRNAKPVTATDTFDFQVSGLTLRECKITPGYVLSACFTASVVLSVVICGASWSFMWPI